MALPFPGSIVSFLVAPSIGGLAIYASAQLIVDVDDHGHAVGAPLSALLILPVLNAVFHPGIGAFGVPGV